MDKLISGIFLIKEKLNCHNISINIEFSRKCRLQSSIEVDEIKYQNNRLEFIDKTGKVLPYDKSSIKHLTVNYHFKDFDLFDGTMLDNTSSLCKPKFYRYTKLYKNVNLR